MAMFYACFKGQRNYSNAKGNVQYFNCIKVTKTNGIRNIENVVSKFVFT